MSVRIVALLIILSGAASIAASLLLYATPYQVGLTHDGLTYFGTARTVLKGGGYYYLGYPLTHYPPGYSTLLAIAGIGDDPINRVRYLHTALYAVNTALVGWVTFKSTSRSLIATLFSVALFLSAWTFQEMHIMAYSEAPFITCLLIILLACGKHLEQPSRKTAIIVALTIAVAILFRYVGIVLIVPLIIMFLRFGAFDNDSTWRQRIIQTGAMVLLAIAPLVLWFGRNRLLSPSTTNRTIGYTPMGWEPIKQMVRTMHNFWFPIRLNGQMSEQMQLVTQATQVGLIVVLVLSIAIYLLLKQRTTETDNNPYATASLLVATTFVSVYIPFLFTSITFFDAVTPLDQRILSIWHLFLLLLIPVAFIQLATLRKEKWIWFVALFGLFISLTFNMGEGIIYARQGREYGYGYTSYRLRPAFETVRLALEQEVDVYTNSVLQVELLFGQQPQWTPRPPQDDFETQMNQVQEDVLAGDAILLLINQPYPRRRSPSAEQLANQYGLPEHSKNDHYIIFGTQSAPNTTSP